MDSLLDLFVAYLRAERGLSAQTVDAYGSDLARYLRGLSASGLERIVFEGADSVNNAEAALV